jgi:glycosyltransferase involved in cell wall biosynthesis
MSSTFDKHDTRHIFEKELLKTYLLELIWNKKLRDAMGDNAMKYIHNNHRWEKVTPDNYGAPAL